jgi:MFS family permease
MASPERPYPSAMLAWSVWGLGALLYLIGFYQRVAPAVMTDALMIEFSIGAAPLGNLAAFYFYSYVAMQIPTGIIADRWGPRRLLTLGAAIASLGGALFALAPSLFWANAGRLLIGASVAVAFVSMLKLATHWFTPRQFTLASAMALLVGVVGGVFAGVPLRVLVESFGWRPVMGATAGTTALLCVAIWVRVRDDPHELGYRSHYAGDHAAIRDTSVLRGLAQALSYRNCWFVALVQGGVAGAVLTFAGLWGVPYLTQVRGLSAKEAAAITSSLFVAWALGGPVLGALSERVRRRKLPYVAGVALAAAGWTAVIYASSLSLPALIAVLLATGFVSGCIIIGFAYAKESVPLRIAGTATGVVNMGTMIGGMILQPAVGWMLDRHWQGALAHGVRIYDLDAYQAGFALMLGWMLAALVLISLSRETFCRQSESS